MENSKPLITVVTLSYNNFTHLLDTVRSVCLQDYERIEYLIYDDCSREFPYEETVRFIEEHNRGNIVHFAVHRNETNQGTVKNINLAYRNAQGEILMPLSCGDVFFSTSVVSEVAKRFEDPDCKVLATSRLLYKGEFEPVGLQPHFLARPIIEKMDTPEAQYNAFITSRFYGMSSGCVLYMRKETFLAAGGFDEAYDLWEDGPFYSHYLWKGKMHFAYDIISIWYEDGGVSANTFDFLSPRMRADVKIYATKDALAHPECFSKKELRMIRYRNARLLCGHTAKRYLYYALYLPEMRFYLQFTKDVKALGAKDMEEIGRVLARTEGLIKGEEG